MTSHELARKLLALPDLPVCVDGGEAGEPCIEDFVDMKDPDVTPYPEPSVLDDREYRSWQGWFDSQPKKKCVSVNTVFDENDEETGQLAVVA